MANLIQIKRSLNTAVPTSLANGEQAYASNGDILYIGANGNVVAIGGARTPGTLTANQATVVNANGFIDATKTNKLVLGADGTTANVTSITLDGTLASVSNTSLASSWAIKNYIDAAAGASTLSGLTDVTISTPANNSFLVYDADAAQWENHTITGATGQIDLTFTGQNLEIGIASAITTSISDAYTNATSYADTAASTARANAIANAVSYASAAAATAYSNATAFAADASNISSGTLSGDRLLANTGIVANSSGVFVRAGTGVTVNTLGVNIGQDVATTASVTFGNANVSGNVAVTGFSDLANSDIGDIKFRGSNVISGQYDRNIIDLGTVGLIINGGNYGVQIKSANDGVSFFTTTFDPDNGAILAPANINATSFTVGSNFIANSTLVTATDLDVTGNTSLGNSNTDTIGLYGRIKTSIVPLSNTTYNLGTAGLWWNDLHVSTVHSTNGSFEDVTISGNLVVNGTLTTIDTDNYVVEDSLIKLARNNNVSDSLDIGLYGLYDTGGTDKYTGLFRDASDGVYKLFKDLEVDPTTTVDLAGAGYAVATLQAYLDTGAFVANTTNIAITANSTVAVAITANTLSLSTALPATSGGTGLNSYTSGDLLVANTSNILSKLALGTNGLILQSNGSALIYSGIDGGSF